jgi:hypothetical protein
MMLFSDNLVSREIRSNIASISDDEDSCGLLYRCANPKGFAHSDRSIPPGVVTIVDSGAPLMPLYWNQDADERLEAESKNDDVVDSGAPLMPLYRNQDADERLEAESKNDDEDDEELYSCKPTMGFIQRTFSFDDHLPIIHRRGASIRQLNACLEDDDDDFYIDEHKQPSFTMPITYSNDNNRSKVLYPVSISGSL